MLRGRCTGASSRQATPSVCYIFAHDMMLYLSFNIYEFFQTKIINPIYRFVEIEHHIERPKYKLLRRIGKAEVRRYPAYLVAEHTVRNGGFSPAMNKGFREVASFIFGGNDRRESVAMTSPVRCEALRGGEASSESEASYTVSFVLPSKYTMASLPRPSSDRVRVREVAAHSAAVLAWRGGVDEAEWERRVTELRAEMGRAGLSAEGPPMLYQYYPPVRRHSCPKRRGRSCCLACPSRGPQRVCAAWLPIIRRSQPCPRLVAALTRISPRRLCLRAVCACLYPPERGPAACSRGGGVARGGRGGRERGMTTDALSQQGGGGGQPRGGG